MPRKCDLYSSSFRSLKKKVWFLNVYASSLMLFVTFSSKPHAAPNQYLIVNLWTEPRWPWGDHATADWGHQSVCVPLVGRKSWGEGKIALISKCATKGQQKQVSAWAMCSQTVVQFLNRDIMCRNGICFTTDNAVGFRVFICSVGRRGATNQILTTCPFA